MAAIPFTDFMVSIGDYGILKERNIFVRELDDNIDEIDLESLIKKILDDI
jgi:hypothetical protein